MGILNKAYIKSDNIKVFPTTKRPIYQNDSALLTESNLVSIVNRLLDANTFVISYDENDELKFNIDGYYFHILNISEIVSKPTQNDTLYAHIRLIKTGDFTELYGLDEDGYYLGVYFTLLNGAEPENKENCLKVLQYTPDDSGALVWNVPKESFYKYDARGLYGTIDCGEI